MVGAPKKSSPANGKPKPVAAQCEGSAVSMEKEEGQLTVLQTEPLEAGKGGKGGKGGEIQITNAEFIFANPTTCPKAHLQRCVTRVTILT